MSFEIDQYAKYHWEFKRRSKKYKDLYKADPKNNLNPKLSYEELQNKAIEQGPVNRLFLMRWLSSGAVKYESKEDERTKLNIKIDFKGVNSAESLKKSFSKLIDDWYVILKSEKLLSKKRKLNMTDFDVILEAGDLWEQGKKNREIAEIIYPRKYKNNPESAIGLVRYYRKRYSELIDGGYRDIVYP